MGHSEFDLAIRERWPWSAGRIVGAKPAPKPQQVLPFGFGSIENDAYATVRCSISRSTASCAAATS
jgi:hypothetical protein